MKFRFCGDLDCPDWALAGISTLSKLTSIKIKLLCAQVLKHLLGGQIDYEKVQKLTADAKFEASEIKASISGLSFILSSAAKHSVDGDSLCRELQQLGLPKEHSTVLCRAYADNLDNLQAEFRKQSLRLSHLESVDWRVDYILSSSKLKDVNEPSVQMRLKVRDPDTQEVKHTSFLLTQDKCRVILNEMKEASMMMDALSSR